MTIGKVRRKLDGKPVPRWPGLQAASWQSTPPLPLRTLLLPFLTTTKTPFAGKVH